MGVSILFLTRRLQANRIIDLWPWSQGRFIGMCLRVQRNGKRTCMACDRRRHPVVVCHRVHQPCGRLGGQDALANAVVGAVEAVDGGDCSARASAGARCGTLRYCSFLVFDFLVLCLVHNCSFLVFDFRVFLSCTKTQYGNYLVQFVLKHKVLSLCQHRLRTALRGRYVAMSRHKMASNVVEQCLRVADAEWRTEILDELLHSSREADLLTDRYGNYVLQTAVEVADDAEANEIAAVLWPHLVVLRPPVAAKWQTILESRTSRSDDVE